MVEMLESAKPCKVKVKEVVLYLSEAARQRCSLEKVLWKYAANLQENTHAEVWFQ